MSLTADIAAPSAVGKFDVAKVRKDFPILATRMSGKPLVYLDNAATSQKPQVVLDAISRYYREQNSNVHRGVHYLSTVATDAYELTRNKIARYINAANEREVIFVKGTTEGVNLVAQSFGKQYIGKGDEVVITALEHHSNIVPWQMICEERGAILRVVPINDDGEILLEEYEKLLTPKTKIAAFAHVSNALGTVNPVKEMIALAHKHGIPVLVDGAQALPHMRVDVRDLDCEFYTFSSHKMFGPTGVGVLYGKENMLNAMPPYQGGGDMIRSVTFEKTTYNELPYKFEAGTPNIADVVGFGAAVDYLSNLDFGAMETYESGLLAYATEALSGNKRVRIIGTSKKKAGVLSFVIEGVHAHDVGTILDSEGIAVRTGHHCAMPVMERFKVPATTRASFAFYNTNDEVDALVQGMAKVIEVFG